jgi:hypothetical protein
MGGIRWASSLLQDVEALVDYARLRTVGGSSRISKQPLKRCNACGRSTAWKSN